jgi:DNA-binding beta-propeller fold protein YncE
MGQLGKGEPGSGPLELFAPKGVSADENRIYVADTRNHRVGVFFRNGELDEHIGGADASGDYRLKGPSGVAVATYYVYVADEGNHRVAVFSKSATVSYTAFFAVLLVIALAIGGAVYYFRNELEELYSVVQGSKGFEVTEDPMKEAEEMRQELWNDGSGGAG